MRGGREKVIALNDKTLGLPASYHLLRYVEGKQHQSCNGSVWVAVRLQRDVVEPLLGHAVLVVVNDEALLGGDERLAGIVHPSSGRDDPLLLGFGKDLPCGFAKWIAP